MVDGPRRDRDRRAELVAPVAGMLAGADSIQDMGLLRHGAKSKLFTGVRASSTLGSLLRSFRFGHEQSRLTLSRVPHPLRWAWILGAGRPIKRCLP